MPKAFRLSIPRSPWSWLALSYCIVPLVVRGFPLAGELQYEFAAIIALVASILSSAVPLLSRASFPAGTIATDGERLWWLALRTLSAALIPLGIYLVLLPFTSQCGIDEGVSWYLLLVLPSAAIGMILGAAIASLVERRWLRILVWVAIWGASLLRGGFEAVEGPHIYLYCWQVGFFPGGSWDAELPIPALLVAYRCWHIAVALGLATVVTQMLRLRAGRDIQSGALALAVVVAVLSLAAIPQRSDLGLTRTESWLRAELGDSLRTRFTTIYYNAATADSLDLWRAANYSDFHIAEQARELGIAEVDVEPITLYLYSSAYEQKRLVGTASASFTKPWKRMINLAFDRVTTTLEHELVHVMIEPYGNPLGISLSQGLLEGAAVAIENDMEWRSIHTDAAALYRLKMAPPPAKIMGVGGFTAQRASVAYLVAGSFSRWLIDTYGMKRYLAAFAWGDFDGAFGRSLDSLSNEYMSFITRPPDHRTPDPSEDPQPPDYRPDTAAERVTMRYLYGGGSFFYQRCLRRLGALNAEGFRALAEERYPEALERFRESMNEGITYSARGGVLRALLAMGRYREMLDSAAVYDRDTASYPLLPFLVERGDAYWALGDRANALRMYDSVARLKIGLSTATRVALRRAFLIDSDSISTDDSLENVGTLMRTYFTRSMSVLQRLEILDRAWRIARVPRERVILALMKGTLLASTLPQTSARIVEESLADSDGQGVNLDLGDGYLAITYLLHGLQDADQYHHLLKGTHERGRIYLNGNSIEYFRGAFLPPFEESTGDQGSDQDFWFTRYLDRFHILP